MIPSAHEPRELLPCPSSRNCARDTQDGPANRRPVAFNIPLADVTNVMIAVLLELPRTRIVYAGERYLRAESRSLMLGFVDDVELLAEPSTRLIHFRSAARRGRLDFGVNRRRLDRLAAAIRRRLGQDGP